MTECPERKLLFQPHGRREVVAEFEGEFITSDAGALLLREVEHRFGIVRQFEACFTDHRSEEAIEFTTLQLLLHRVMGLALGYEDLNDHDRLRHDPLLALVCGRQDVTGQDRLDERDRGKPLAGKSTLNRLELTPAGASAESRYKTIAASIAKLQQTLVDVFLRLQSKLSVPEQIVIDVDATDDPIHGDQLGKFFHGYYKNYCFLPPYAFCEGWPLPALLRPSNLDASAGTVPHPARIVKQIRQAWPSVRIIVRGDGAFCREPIMAWCEQHHVKYLFGLGKNTRLTRILGRELQQAKELFEQTGKPARVFKDFEYRTHKSWSTSRRVVGKAEHLWKGPNPRFIVTNLTPQEMAAQPLYEVGYCGRGDMENRIKEQQLFLFADRTSTHSMRSNQLRLMFSTIAYVLHKALKEFGTKGTSLATAQVDTIRIKLLKIGARIQVGVRRIHISLSEAYPFREVLGAVFRNLRHSHPPPHCIH